MNIFYIYGNIKPPFFYQHYTEKVEALPLSNRINMVNEQIKRILSEIIRNMKNPALDSLISVVAVETTSDFSLSKVYVSIFGDDKKKSLVLDAIKNSSGFIRKELGRKIKLHATPALVFILDDSIEKSAHINKLISDINSKKTKG